MSAHVKLNISKEFRKIYEMRSLPNIFPIISIHSIEHVHECWILFIT